MLDRAAPDDGDDVRGRAIERLKGEISLRRETDLKAQSRYHRERLLLHRAKDYGSEPTTPARVHELERASQDADRRLRHFRLTSQPATEGETKQRGEGNIG